MSTKTGAIVEFKTARVQASLTRPANATAYTAGDAVSATGDGHLEFPGAVEVGRLSGSISNARLISGANQATKLDAELWLFRSDIADVADNAAFAPTDAELLTLVGIIDFPVADWKIGNATAGAGGNAVCEVTSLGIAFKAAESKIYGQLVARNGYTPVSGEVFSVELVITQD